jgi:hypothetical protein
MVKTVYVCDKCGKEWTATNPCNRPVMLGITIQFGVTDFNTYPGPPIYQAMWCKQCVIKTGISAPGNKEEVKIAPVTPLTFEEKFVLLLDELGVVRK